MKEDNHTEFKAIYTKQIIQTIIAFANTNGGSIYIGVDDNGNAIGLKEPDQTMTQLTNAIRDSIRPDVTLFTDESFLDIEGKTTITVRVERGSSVPYYIAGKGLRPSGVYVRQGASSVPASEERILSMLRETGIRFEENKSFLQELSFEETETYFKKRDIPFGRAEMKTLGLIGQDNDYTNLGLLFSDQNPFSAKLAVFTGQEKIEFQNRFETSGSILKQIEEVVSFIEPYNQLHALIKGIERQETYDYSAECIREGIINAFVHREYGLSGSILISIFSDRIEILSPGAVPGGYTLSDILFGVSSPRNPRLAAVFYRLKLIEAYGTGLRRIQDFYPLQTYGTLVEVSDNAFRLILPNRNGFITKLKSPGEVKDEPRLYDIQSPSRKITNDERKTQIKDYLLKEGTITRKKVEILIGVSQALASKLLREMIDQGEILRIGKGPAQYYVLSSENCI